MNILTRYDLDTVAAETDLFGDVEEWMAAYEQGIMAIAWSELEVLAHKALSEWRDRFP